MRRWLVFMCGEDEKDIFEMVDPIYKYFDGIVATCHSDKKSDWLESVKGDGKIIYLPYSRRHDFSRNAYLFCGPMENGDWCIQTDVLEYPQPKFLEDLDSKILNFMGQRVNFCYYYGKPFLFKYHESLKYQGSPHEGLLRGDGQMSAIELNMFYPKEEEVRKNMRPIKRIDPFGWVDHYAKYMLFPFGSNHSLLGLEHRGEVQVLFPAREKLRMQFLEEMGRRGYCRTVQGLKGMLQWPLDDKLKFFLNNEKVWQDFYRYHIMNDKTVVDEHKWTSMIKL